MKNRERIEALESRVTRLEERATFQQVEIPTATLQPRPWRVGDVVRLERYDDCKRTPVGHEGKIYRFDIDGRVGVEPHWMWPASALTLIRAAGEPQSCADLQREVERLTVERDTALENLRCTKMALNTTREQRDKFWSQRDEALDKLDAMTAERDALRARIQAGTVVYWEDVNDETGWSLLTKTRMRGDTYTALMIDIAPIAADERRGERRKGQEMKLNWGAFGGRQFGTSATHPFSMQDKRTTNSDRRRTPGTRADRGES